MALTSVFDSVCCVSLKTVHNRLLQGLNLTSDSDCGGRLLEGNTVGNSWEVPSRCCHVPA